MDYGLWVMGVGEAGMVDGRMKGDGESEVVYIEYEQSVEEDRFLRGGCIRYFTLLYS